MMNKKRMAMLLKSKQAMPRDMRDAIIKPIIPLTTLPEIALITRKEPLQPIATKQHQSKSHQPRFRDAYLLTEKIRQLLDKSTERSAEAFELVKNNPSIANVEVYGTLMSLLLRKGKQKEALDTYDMMIENKYVEPNPQSYTLYMTALARSAKFAQPLEKSNLFQLANDLFIQIQPTLSQTHLNCLLKVCVSCANEGGWEKAFGLFERILIDEPHKLDTITFSIMLSLCAENRSQDGYNATRHIWTTFQKLKQNEEAEGVKREKKQLRVDARLVCNVLLSCIRTKDMNDALFGMELVKEYIGLPESMKDKFSYTDYRIEVKNHAKFAIDAKALDVLLRYASRIKQPDLALKWYSIAVKELGVLTDDVIQESVVQLCIEKKDFVSALDIALKSPEQSRTTSSHAMIIKICEEAMRLPKAQIFGEAFAKTVTNLTLEPHLKINPETYHLLLTVMFEKQMYNLLYGLLKVPERRTELIESSRGLFERALLANEQSAVGKGFMESYLNDSWAVKEGGYHHEKELFYRVESLKVLRECIKEFVEFKGKLMGQGRVESRYMAIVGKQVDDVLLVWDDVKLKSTQ